MSARSTNRTRESRAENVLQKNVDIPVQLTEMSTFDDDYSSMKERFQAQMRRMDEEMTRFSTTLMYLYGQPVPGVTASAGNLSVPANWDSLANSPLVTGEGEARTLQLQFDVSSFNPNEVTVKILDNVLVVSAVHDEKTDNSAAYSEYHREFLLPRGIDKDAIVSSLSRDGVLTIQAPMPQLEIADNTQRSNAPRRTTH